MDYDLKCFENHLEKICKNNFLKDSAREYYHLIKENDFSLPKGCIEPLVIKTQDKKIKTFTADAELELFKDKKEILFSEYFVFCFNNYLKELAFNKTIRNVQDFRGWYTFKDKKITITRQNEKEYIRANSEFNKDNMPAYSKEIFEGQSKLTTFHELTHLTEIKTYENGKFFTIGGKNFVSTYPHTINRCILKMNNLYDFSKHNDSIIKKMYELGSDAFSEVMNDYFTAMITGKEVIIANAFFNENSDYYAKSTYGLNINGNYVDFCSYCKNFDMIVFLNIAMSPLSFAKFRLSTNKFIQEFNNLPFNPKVTIKCKDFLKKNYIAGVDDIDNYTLFTIILGLEEQYKKFERPEIADRIQAITEIFLLSACENKIKHLFENKDIVKNQEFFENINYIISELDSVLLYYKKDPKNIKRPAKQLNNIKNFINFKIATLNENEKQLANSVLDKDLLKITQQSQENLIKLKNHELCI